MSHVSNARRSQKQLFVHVGVCEEVVIFHPTYKELRKPSALLNTQRGFESSQIKIWLICFLLQFTICNKKLTGTDKRGNSLNEEAASHDSSEAFVV